MKRKWMILAPIGLLLFIAAGGEVVRQLWNWLLPQLFGWREISFWQALGLLALCRILFGSFGGGGASRSGIRRRISERWDHMSPEEREQFRQGMRRCAGFSEVPGEGRKE